ncbi:MAG TPA: His/Gly/Thr/Pro-type tRNA ligase C-terminal domain-containing protein, partial [Thermomicrobiales bacterium]|nr:His/Gly/Thr/Pro-type tRNA ligase C-terminal domain-containing protein [Thermomicrobiales bacterium]
IVADIAAAENGFSCPVCGTPMKAERAIEVGNIFKLGTRFSAAFGATYLDDQGQSHPIEMGSYGIGSGRVAATIAEQHHDDKGLRWPISVAPYHVSLLWLGAEQDTDVIKAADKLNDDLAASGVEVLYDDRPERAGVKFNDADLIGNPIRISVSPRTLAKGEAEIKARAADKATFVPLEEAVTHVTEMLNELRAQMAKTAGNEM